MLEKKKSRFASLDREVLLDFSSDTSTKRWISKNYIVTIFFLNIVNIFRKRIHMSDIRRFNTVQDHIHDADDVSERFYLFTIKSFILKSFHLTRRKRGFILHKIIIRFHQKSCASTSAIINSFTNLRFHYLNNSFNKWPWRVVFTTVSSGVPHILNFRLIEMRKLVFLFVQAKMHTIHNIQ